MSTPDHYAILGVPRGADEEEIKRAFRRLAREWHPDVNSAPDAAERFQMIAEAHEVLLDEARRREYDLARALPQLDTSWREADAVKFEDLLENLFAKGTRAGRPGGRAPEAGGDIAHRIRIGLADAAHGRTDTVTYAARRVCTTCQGTGGAPGATLIRCTGCGGEGQVQEMTSGPFGEFAAVRDCPTCHGAGEVLSDPCARCTGSGRMRGSRTATVQIPPGVTDGQKIRLPGQGHDGDVGAHPGDLIVTVDVSHDPRFIRDGLDLVSILELPVLDAMLGAHVTVPTAYGELMLEVPSGTTQGDELRLPGRGMPSLTDEMHVGDHRFRVHLVVPAALTGDARAAVEHAREVMSPLEAARVRLRPQSPPT